MIARKDLEDRVRRGLQRSPVVALLGPRQCGKSTLARIIAERTTESHVFDLEDPEDDLALREAKLNLAPLEGLVVLDEIQRRPDLFDVLRVLVDRNPQRRFLLLGSASPDLVRGGSESLAGRIEFVHMQGFSLAEVGVAQRDVLWMRGGFPRSFLAAQEEDSRVWRENFIRTFLERDIPALGLQLAPDMLRRFWTMAAHYHGQVWNASSIGRSIGRNHVTVNGYLDVLAGSFVMRRLPPWFSNVGKRLVRSPKTYVRDSGLLHALLRIPDQQVLRSHHMLGASWEGFALDQVLAHAGDADAYFYATHSGAEIDLLLQRGGGLVGFEFKFASAPAMTKSLHTVLDDLALERACIVHPGERRYALAPRVDVVPLAQLPEWLAEAGLLRE